MPEGKGKEGKGKSNGGRNDDGIKIGMMIVFWLPLSQSGKSYHTIQLPLAPHGSHSHCYSQTLLRDKEPPPPAAAVKPRGGKKENKKKTMIRRVVTAAASVRCVCEGGL